MYVRRLESAGIAPCEGAAEILDIAGQFLAALSYYLAAVERNHCNQLGQAVEIQMLPYAVVDKEQPRVGVVDDMRCVGRIEIMQYGYDDRSVGERGHEDADPVGRVLAEQGYFVARAYTGSLEKQMQSRYTACYVVVSEGLVGAVIGDGRQVAVVNK